MKTCLMLLLIVVIAGCDNHNSDLAPVGSCATRETVEHFPWVMKLIDDLGRCSACTTSVVSGEYDGKTVIFTIMNDPICDGIFTGPLYDCRGNVVKYLSASAKDQEEFHTKLSASMILGQCKDFPAPLITGG